MLLTTDLIYGEFGSLETLLAVQCGQKRTEASQKRRDNWGLKNDNEVEDSRRQTIGTLGEFALMKHFKQDLTCSVNTFKQPDLYVRGWGIQVKASERATNLIIRPDAKDYEPYVLVQVEIPDGDPRTWTRARSRYFLMGWMFPYYARLWADLEPSMWRDPNGRNSPAIFVPRDWLESIRNLEGLTKTPPPLYN